MATPPPIIIPAELDDAGLSPAAFRILCHLIRRGAAQESGAWGSVKNMASLCKMDLERVKISLKDLIESGWIERISRPGFTSIYRLLPQAEKQPRRKNNPGGISDHPPGGISDHPPGGISDHEGVTGRSQEKGIPPNPPLGGQTTADLTSEPTPNGTESTSHSTLQKKENGPDIENTIRDIPTALDALAPLLTAMGRDPRQRLTAQEEHDLLPILRTPAGLRPADIAALTDLMRQREAVHFTALPDDSPLRSVKRKFSTLLQDWPNQLALAAKLTQKKTPGGDKPKLTPSYPWQAVHWHFCHEEPPAIETLYRRDHIRYAATWKAWTEPQRQTALHRYTHRLTTPIETELQTA
jgi:hypothetical protein